MKKSSTSKAKQIQQKNVEREKENNKATTIFESLTNSITGIHNEEANGQTTIIDIIPKVSNAEEEEEKVDSVVIQEERVPEEVMQQQQQPQYVEGETEGIIIVDGGDREEDGQQSSSSFVTAVDFDGTGLNRKRKQSSEVIIENNKKSLSSSLAPRSNGIGGGGGSKRSTSTNTKKYVRTDRDINFAALLEYANQHGHCNIAVNETYACDLPPAIGTYGGQEDAPFHYEGPLGYWLHEELGRLRRKKGNKAMRERQAFQDLVDQGKLNPFPVDAGALISVTPTTPKAVVDPNVPREKRATVHIEWNLCYNALLDYKSKHGHCNVHQKDVYECVLPGFGEDGGDYIYRGRLGRWLDNQRQFKKNGRLSADKYALLQEQVEQGLLYWDGSDMSHAGLSRTHEGVDWNKHYAALIEYGKVFNTCNVPQKYTFECDIPVNAIIGAGTGIRRLNASAAEIINNSTSILPAVTASTAGVVNAATIIGVDEGNVAGVTIDSGSDSSAQGVSVIAAAATTGGGVEEGKVIADIDIENSVYHYKGRLGRWLDNQRQFKKGNGGKLYPERDAKLQALVDEGKLAWHSQGTSSAQQKRAVSEEEWPKHYAALIEYLKENPTRGTTISQTLRYSCDIPDPNSGEVSMIRYNGKLGRWCAAQRKIKRERDRHSGSNNSGSSGNSTSVAATNMYVLYPDREALMQQLVDEGKFSWVVRSGSSSAATIPSHSSSSSSSHHYANAAGVNGNNVHMMMDDHNMQQHQLVQHQQQQQHNLLVSSSSSTVFDDATAAAVGVMMDNTHDNNTNTTDGSGITVASTQAVVNNGNDANAVAVGVITTAGGGVNNNNTSAVIDNSNAIAIDAIEQFSLPVDAAVYNNNSNNNNHNNSNSSINNISSDDNNILMMMASYNNNDEDITAATITMNTNNMIDQPLHHHQQ